MRRTVVLLLLLSFTAPAPVRAGIDTNLEPVEQRLIDQQKQREKKALEEEMSREFREKQAEQYMQPVTSTASKESAGSDWWKWAIGAALIGGIAAAATAGDGDGSSGNSGGSTGSATATW